MLALALGGFAGCNSASKSAALTDLDPATRKKVDEGIVEPGFTPAMAYAALGKPTVPADARAETMVDGTWEYQRLAGNPRDFIRNGYRHRLVYDPTRRVDIKVVEPVDARLFPHLRDHKLVITFQDSRVTSVKRIDLP